MDEVKLIGRYEYSFVNIQILLESDRIPLLSVPTQSSACSDGKASAVLPVLGRKQSQSPALCIPEGIENFYRA